MTEKLRYRIKFLVNGTGWNGEIPYVSFVVAGSAIEAQIDFINQRKAVAGNCYEFTVVDVSQKDKPKW